ncbi:MAG: 50S ribosomal protein L4 [archaeon]|nr:50S ribosomal protein L4 [archaeon]
MKAHVILIDGKKGKEMELPKQFSASVDMGLIKRAVQAIQSARAQTHYPTPLAGRDNTAEYIGMRGKPQMHRIINTETARKPKLKNRRSILSGQTAGIPAVVGGPRAHPPKQGKQWEEKINKKEKQKATESAIAATTSSKLAKERGHIFSEELKFPVIIEDKFEGSKKTSDVKAALEAIGVWADVEKAKAKRQLRAGKGKKRGRKYKKRKSVLIVTGQKAQVFKGARNLEGVDVVCIDSLNANLLAPGAQPGRLTLWTESAIKALASEKKEAKIAA